MPDFSEEDFKDIQVKYEWTDFNVLVAVCDKVMKNKSLYNVKQVNKLSKKKTTSVRHTNKKKSRNNAKQSQTDGKERPIKKVRVSYHPYDETETGEIVEKKKRKRVSVSKPVQQVPQGNNKTLSKAQREELASILAQKHDLPNAFREKIKEMNQTGDAKLVIQKMLYAADVKQDQNRFSMPQNQLRCTDFLTEEEKRFVEVRTKDNHLKSIKVKVIEPSEELTVGEANFTKWNINNSMSYLLNGAWSGIRKRNNFEAGMFVQLWSFRVNKELCFALVKLPMKLEIK